MRFGHDEQPDLVEAGNVRRGQLAEPAIIPIVETRGGVRLDERDTIEDATAHIAGAFPRVAAATGDEQRLLPWFEARGQVCVFGFAKEALADRRNAHWGDVKVDERTAVVFRLWPGGGCGVAATLESRVDRIHAEAETRNGAVADER